jgi:hypothetical protein
MLNNSDRLIGLPPRALRLQRGQSSITRACTMSAGLGQHRNNPVAEVSDAAAIGEFANGRQPRTRGIRSGAWRY